MTIGYVVSRWPRLSQTFVLNEILALERLGAAVHIFAIKDPEQEPIHPDVARVRAPVAQLSLRRHWQSALRANLYFARAYPDRYRRTLALAVQQRRVGVVRRFLQSCYLAELVLALPVQQLHAHFATAPTLVSMFAHLLTGVPYTFTAHARDIFVDTQAALLGLEVQHAKGVITVSEYNRRYFLNQLAAGAPDKIQSVHNGIDVRDFPPRARAASDGAPIILSVGRLIEKKGMDDLITACGILKARGRSFCLQILGAGPLRKPLEAQAEVAGLDGHVQFLGPQSQDVVREAYRKAAIFALPCVITRDGDRDGIPTVLLEAMASQLPVVSTPISGIPELVDSWQDGVLVEVRRPDELANVLEQLLDSRELRERLGQAARRKIEEQFSIDASAAQLLSLFEAVER